MGHSAHLRLHSVNTRPAFPCRLLAGFSLVLGLLLAGCDFKHPYGEPSDEPIDPALVGSWIESETVKDKGPSTLEVEAVTGSEFRVKFNDRTFTARRVKGTPDNFLQLQLPASKDGDTSAHLYTFCFFGLVDGELVVKRLTEPDGASFETPESVQAYVGRALAGETFTAYRYRFRRK